MFAVLFSFFAQHKVVSPTPVLVHTQSAFKRWNEVVNNALRSIRLEPNANSDLNDISFCARMQDEMFASTGKFVKLDIIRNVESMASSSPTYGTEVAFNMMRLEAQIKHGQEEVVNVLNNMVC